MKNFYNKKRAFTFTETMLVMVIIGVILSITIPTLNHATYERERKTKLTKMYPVLDNVINLVVLENMGIKNLPFGTKDSEGNDEFSKLLVKKLNIAIDCKNSTTLKCWPNATFNGKIFNTDANYYKIQLFDENDLAIQTYENCNGKIKNDLSSDIKNICAEIYVDISMKNPPNKWGQDVFAFVFTSDKGLLPSSKATKEIIDNP